VVIVRLSTDSVEKTRILTQQGQFDHSSRIRDGFDLCESGKRYVLVNALPLKAIFTPAFAADPVMDKEEAVRVVLALDGR
jgi:hypothetical protein